MTHVGYVFRNFSLVILIDEYHGSSNSSIWVISVSLDVLDDFSLQLTSLISALYIKTPAKHLLNIVGRVRVQYMVLFILIYFFSILFFFRSNT